MLDIRLFKSQFNKMPKRYTPRYSRPRRARRPSRFPSATYGKMYYPRDTPWGLDRWGPTAALATPEQLAMRRSDGWVGRGKYGHKARRIAAGFGRFAKGAVALAPAALSAAQMAASMYSGGGLYGGQGLYSSAETVSNQLMEGGRSAPVTIAANDETDTLVLSDCEFVKDIYAGSTAFAFGSQTINVNPGLPGFAPNLSQIAVNYTEYELVQCVFELRPVVSENSVNNGQTGVAMMVFNYNPNDDPFDNKEDVMQAHGSVSGRIVERIVCGVECDSEKTNKTKFFVRSGPIPIGKDADEYDHGILTIATNNIPSTFSNTQIFELWCSYTVKLRKRKAGALRLLNQQSDKFAIITGPTNTAHSNFIGSKTFVSGNNGWAASQQNNIGCFLKPSGAFAHGVIIIFPADINGFFDISFSGESVSGAGISASSSITPIFTGNVASVSDLIVGGADGLSIPNWHNYLTNANGWMYRLRISVKSVTSGIDNSVTIPFALAGSGSVLTASVEVTEFTVAHFTNRRTPRPVLINIENSALITY